MYDNDIKPGMVCRALESDTCMSRLGCTTESLLLDGELSKLRQQRKENLHCCPSPCFVPKVTLCDRTAITRWTTTNKSDELSLSLAVAAASPMLHTGTAPWKSHVLSRELGHQCPSWAAAPEWPSCFPRNRNHRGNKKDPGL